MLKTICIRKWICKTPQFRLKCSNLYSIKYSSKSAGNHVQWKNRSKSRFAAFKVTARPHSLIDISQVWRAIPEMVSFGGVWSITQKAATPTSGPGGGHLELANVDLARPRSGSGVGPPREYSQQRAHTHRRVSSSRNPHGLLPIFAAAHCKPMWITNINTKYNTRFIIS